MPMNMAKTPINAQNTDQINFPFISVQPRSALHCRR
jgi:hypothetical protein